MTENGVAWRYIAGALLGISLLVGGWLRLSGLPARSITHPEIYVPGIPLPEGISEPAERMTVSRILTGTFSSDTHPPGYYLLMLPWTRIAGAGLTAIRLPSALFGVACIPLIFWLGSLAGWRISGGVAATLLAFNGYHLFWSKVARMFALGCFLGLAASVLLLLLARGSRRPGILITLYIIVILAGTATHVFFWSLFATHMIWAFANASGRRELPEICRAQLLALILGSPLIAFAAYQSGNTVADLSSNALLYLSQFLPFAFALPSSISGFFPGAVPFTGNAFFQAARIVLFLIASALFINGLRQLFRTPSKASAGFEASYKWRFWNLAWVAAAVAGTLEIGGFVFMVRRMSPEFVNSTIHLTRVLTILPFTFMLLAFILERLWTRLPQPGRWKRFVAGENGLIALLAILPLLMLSLLAQFRPVLNQRGLLFAAPYLLLLLAIGIVTLQRKIWIAALVPLVAITCIASLKSYATMTVDPADYTRFANAIMSEIGSNDLVFVRKAWYETPILYYLHKDRYRLIGGDFGSACTRNPDARVWVVMLYDADPAREMQSALTGYHPVKTITAPHAKAILYEHRAG
jgi:uncharacterized membrane protein